MTTCCLTHTSQHSFADYPGTDPGGGCRGCAPPPRDDLRLSNTTGILQKKNTMWFIGVEVEQETSAPPPKKNPGSAPVIISPTQEFIKDKKVSHTGV